MLPAHPTSSLVLEKNLRILIVDDNEAIHDDFRKVLTVDSDRDDFDAEDAEMFGESNLHPAPRTSFELTYATQGQEAVDLVQIAAATHQPYALAFIDVRMPPGMDGLETSAKLWAIAPDLQIVICTAHSDKSWEEMAAALPHPERVLILKKPFDSIEVLQLAHALTEKWSLLKAVQFNVNELERTVTARNQELTATNALLTAEAALHLRAQERVIELAQLLDKAQDAIIMSDANERIVYWNKGAERIYGWTVDEATGKDAIELLAKNKPTEADEARRLVMEKGEWTGELRHQTKTGSQVLVECRWTMLYDPEGKPKARLGIHTDITERRQLADQVLRMQRLESIGTLASGVAHDLNNALSPIMLGIELLRLRLPADPHASLLNTMDISAQRGREIVRQILTFASGVDGEHTTIAIGDLIREQEKICRNTFYKLIEIQAEVASDLWNVTGDATQLHQVLMNLCVNARDAMPDGGCLYIGADNIRLGKDSPLAQGVGKPGPYVLITVSDTGTGISPQIIERIFDPFFTTKGRDQGTGLGLSTVQGIVHQHGGFIDASSEPGLGTTFRVYIPANVGAAVVAVLPPPPISPPPAGNHECILVVDDEQSIRQIIKSTLEIQGYEVLVARSGEDAIALFQQHPDDIAVVITDLAMPGLDGHATIEALQQIRPGVTVIAMSGGLSKAQKAQTRNHGKHVSFLQKPFSGDTLLTTLHEVLRGKLTS